MTKQNLPAALLATRECCQIRWIDKQGNPTPDTNPAVGLCYRIAYTYIRHDGTGCPMPETERSLICAAHLKRLNTLECALWRFEPFYGPAR